MTEAVIYRNQSIDLQSKSMDWFLYDNVSVMKELNIYPISDIAFQFLTVFIKITKFFLPKLKIVLENH